MVNEILEGTLKNLNVGWYPFPITADERVSQKAPLAEDMVVE